MRRRRIVSTPKKAGRPKGQGPVLTRVQTLVKPEVLAGIVQANERAGRPGYPSVSELIRRSLDVALVEMGGKAFPTSEMAGMYLLQKGLCLPGYADLRVTQADIVALSGEVSKMTK